MTTDVVGRWVGEGVRRRLDDPALSRHLDDLERKLAEFASRERQVCISDGPTRTHSRG